MKPIQDIIAEELNASPHQVLAAIKLLDQGATVPFIARYRKPQTERLTDAQLRKLTTRLSYLRQLDERRHSILDSLRHIHALTPALLDQFNQCTTKARLEDLYQPYKPKRQGITQQARDAGFTDPVTKLYEHPETRIDELILPWIGGCARFQTQDDVRQGFAALITERVYECASLRAYARKQLQQKGLLRTEAVQAAQRKKTAVKYQDYYAHQELASTAPSHRIFAMCRGRQEGILHLNYTLEAADEAEVTAKLLSTHLPQLQDQATHTWMREVLLQAWSKKLKPYLEKEGLIALKERAETHAIEVFSQNVYDVLMHPPAGHKAILGVDPGLKTGVKLAIIDQMGDVKQHATIFPHEPQKAWNKSKRTLKQLLQMGRIEIIALGNGIGSRETDTLIQEVLDEHPELQVDKMIVSEAGASVYSASEYASEELGNLDVSLRGAVSIARRVQNPMAELIKIDPKAIGVGQYQHDVNQTHLSDALRDTLEDAVNRIGVDLNTASAALLSHVAGISPKVARHIVSHRSKFGPFQNRQDLKKVYRLGDKTFQQAAGFLRITSGGHPLDATAIHPESYALVEIIAQAAQVPLHNILGNACLEELDVHQKLKDTFDASHITDVITQLKEGTQDPRGTFTIAQTSQHLIKIEDLKPNMMIEGIVSNVANFGAFVDIGLQQKGLIHISELADRFVEDPRKIIKTGDHVKVKVTDVDVSRERINLSMRLKQTKSSSKQDEKKTPLNKVIPKRTMTSNRKSTQRSAPQKNEAMASAFADALAKLKS